ncbi:MAG TPA: hypothetical protein VKA03_03825 [Methylovirgula sp.]|nr:hypothetical protein [Methylovirgula sp.]
MASMIASRRKADSLAAGIARMSTNARWAMQHARWTMGITSPHELFARSKLVLDTVDFMARLAACEIHVFTRETGGASHCQMEAIAAAAAIVMDWLDTLVRRSSARPQKPLVSDAIIELMRKHHGARAAEHARLAVSSARGSVSR